MIRIKKENDMIDHISAIYAEKEIELSWPIGLGVVYNEN